jgi:hypothetical protein
MALTQKQARDGYIIDSMALFLDRNLKQAYDAEVATLAFTTPLVIRRGKTDNKSNPLVVPGVYVDTISGTEKDEDYALGVAIEWRHINFVFYCFPATLNGEPDQEAADLLKAYMRDTFGTKYIRIVDYSNPLCTASNVLYTPDVMERTRKQDPMDRKATTTIAEEVHRFDMHVSVRYPVIASTAA